MGAWSRVRTPEVALAEPMPSDEDREGALHTVQPVRFECLEISEPYVNSPQYVRRPFVQDQDSGQDGINQKRGGLPPPLDSSRSSGSRVRCSSRARASRMVPRGRGRRWWRVRGRGACDGSSGEEARIRARLRELSPLRKSLDPIAQRHCSAGRDAALARRAVVGHDAREAGSRRTRRLARERQPGRRVHRRRALRRRRVPNQ